MWSVLICQMNFAFKWGMCINRSVHLCLIAAKITNCFGWAEGPTAEVWPGSSWAGQGHWVGN